MVETPCELQGVLKCTSLAGKTNNEEIGTLENQVGFQHGFMLQ